MFGSKVHPYIDILWLHGARIDKLDNLINTDKREYTIRNCVEKILCVIGCIGTVLLAVAWAFYLAERCKFTYTVSPYYCVNSDF